MYRIIGIIALVGTLAGCNNPTVQQPDSKTFEGEYKVILQSGPFRGPLQVRYGVARSDINMDLLTISDASSLPWSVKKRDPVLISHGRKHGVIISASYSRPTSATGPTQETVYRLELWINDTLRKTGFMKLRDDEPLIVVSLVDIP